MCPITIDHPQPSARKSPWPEWILPCVPSLVSRSLCQARAYERPETRPCSVRPPTGLPSDRHAGSRHVRREMTCCSSVRYVAADRHGAGVTTRLTMHVRPRRARETTGGPGRGFEVGTFTSDCAAHSSPTGHANCRNAISSQRAVSHQSIHQAGGRRSRGKHPLAAVPIDISQAYGVIRPIAAAPRERARTWSIYWV